MPSGWESSSGWYVRAFAISRRLYRLVDEVCEFSELGDYIHMPMRTYSSGMAMRLAFAVSTSVTANIILIDKRLSVGDAQFAQKTEERLRKMVGNVKILVIASHSPQIIEATCNRVVKLHHGQIIDP